MSDTRGIRKRGDSWQVRVYAGVEDGRDVYLARTVHGTLKTAIRVREELAADVEAARARRGGGGVRRDSVEIYFATWIEDVAASGVALSTVASWRSRFNEWVLPAIGSKRLDAVTADDVKAVYRKMHRAKKSKSTARNTHIALRRFFRDAIRSGIASTSPMAHVDPPRLDKRPPAPPTPAEVARLMARADGYGDGDSSKRVIGTFGVFVRVAFATAARRGEVAALQWRDVDFERGTIHIRRAIEGDRVGELSTKSTKTHADKRLDVDPVTLAVLQGHRTRMQERALGAGRKLRSTAYLFSSDPVCAVPYPPHWATRAWSRVRASVGLDHVPLKDLRHAAATTMLDAGVPLSTVSSVLRHAEESTTLVFYAGRTAGSAEKAVAALGAVAASVAG